MRNFIPICPGFCRLLKSVHMTVVVVPLTDGLDGNVKRLSVVDGNCFDNECQNGGECVEHNVGEKYWCNCPPEYTGDHCETR